MCRVTRFFYLPFDFGVMSSRQDRRPFFFGSRLYARPMPYTAIMQVLCVVRLPLIVGNLSFIERQKKKSSQWHSEPIVFILGNVYNRETDKYASEIKIENEKSQIPNWCSVGCRCDLGCCFVVAPISLTRWEYKPPCDQSVFIHSIFMKNNRMLIGIVPLFKNIPR